jgi:hypothetical protein
LRSPFLAAALVGWSLAAGGSARAQLYADLAPSVGGGATDNATLTANGVTPTSDAFGTVGGSALLHYETQRASHALAYRFMLTHYVAVDVPVSDGLSNGLSWVSSFNPTARLSLQLTLNALLSRVSNVDPANPATVVPQAAVGGSTLYLNSAAGQGLTYQPTPRAGYSELLTVSQVRYLETETPLPTTTLVATLLRATRLIGRELYALDVAIADSITSTDPTLMQGTSFSQGQTFLVQALLGWRHDLSPLWSTMLQAGPSTLIKLDGTGVLAPAGSATISYSRVPWFAALNISQAPAANLYLGDATITDQVMVRVGLPLTRNELFYVGGYGAYLYARIADGQAQLSRDFDQFSGSVSLFARFGKLPFGGALTYMALSQRGSSLPNHEIPDLARQTVMLTVSGLLRWGKGTPPLFSGL